MIALLEVESLLGSPQMGTVIGNPNKPWLTINVQVVLQRVTDLTELAAQQLLGTSIKS